MRFLKNASNPLLKILKFYICFIQNIYLLNFYIKIYINIWLWSIRNNIEQEEANPNEFV
jgi:hypothetical protein